MKFLEILGINPPDNRELFAQHEQSLSNILHPLLDQIDENFQWPIAPIRITDTENRIVSQEYEYNNLGRTITSSGVLMAGPLTGREEEIAQISTQYHYSLGSASRVIYQAHLTKDGEVGTTRLIGTDNYQESTNGPVRDQIVMALLVELQNRGLSVNELTQRQ